MRAGGFFLLKPAAMSMFRLFNAVTVECWALKPCWKLGIGRFSLRIGRINLSKILMAGQNNKRGL